MEKVYTIITFSPSTRNMNLPKAKVKSRPDSFPFLLKADDKNELVDRFCDGLKYFLLACSWGGYESLIFPSSVLYSAKAYTKPPDLPWNLIRFYVDSEDPESAVRILNGGVGIDGGRKN
ncbi:MAG: hypothetical protein R3B93_28990 [Bacteroidia bacterium]